MAEAATKFPVRTEEKKVDRPAEWRPFESLRREIDRLFEDFQVGPRRSPFGREHAAAHAAGIEIGHACHRDRGSRAA